MRILMSMFGWRDSGGGTVLPRLKALELKKRGHEVLVVYSAVPQIPNAGPYAVREHEDEGVKLIGIHNRPALFLDDKAPEREVNDPRVVKIFQYYFNQFQPDIVHYHNFLGLSLGITQIAHEAGLPSFYTPYNFWLLCPTLYLNLPDLSLCQGVNASGSNCLQCTRAPLPGQAYVQRRNQLRAQYQAQIGPCLASSECVRDLLLHNGYEADQVELLKFGNQRAAKIWKEVGVRRLPGANECIHIGFTGAVIPIKGVHVLVAAAQLLKGNVKITIYGEAAPDYQAELERLDQKNLVHFAGFFANEDHSRILSELDLAVVPSVCFDHSPLVIGEFLAARVPVVGANIGGIPDYIPEGCGELFEAGAPEALAQSLQGLIDQPERIAKMQAQIQEPLSFNDYVGLLEDRYQKALDNRGQEQQRRRARQFLRQRGHGLIYGASHFEHIAGSLPPEVPYGVDLTPESIQLNFSQELLEQAEWVIVSDTLLLEQVDYPNSAPGARLVPRMHPRQGSSTEIGLPEEFSEHWLIPFMSQGHDWQNYLAAFLRSEVQSDRICILFPMGQDLESAQDKLLDWIEEQGFDPENGPELMLLEADDTSTAVQEIFEQISLLILPDECQNNLVLREYAYLAPQILAKNSPALEPIGWLAKSPPAAFSEIKGLQSWSKAENLTAIQEHVLTQILELVN